MKNVIAKILSTLSSIKEKTNLKKIALLFAVLVLLVGGVSQVILQKRSFTTTTQAKPAIITTVGKSFDFTAYEIGKNTSIQSNANKVKFTIVSAELQNEIKVKGEPRKAPDGKTFLMMRFELNNETTKRLSFISPDYIRLVGEGDKKYSPDFHNGVVVLDPLSVRNDLNSFVVDAKQKKFTFLIGELDKTKEKIEIIFK